MSDLEPVDMSELVADMEDWSLQAIVRGSSGDVDIDMGFQTSFSDQDFLAGFPDIFEVFTGSSDQLEELYKPFYSPSLLDQSVLDIQHQNLARDKRPHDQSSGTSSVTTAYTPKYKNRKNQHKKVVTQVSAEGLSSDMWAWRKYGQKPIKGSPYPRSYYRCSSSKGCLARKQVEQSCTDPGMFIITYTSEHSHSKPTRRNSLAGTVRQKFPSPKTQNPTTVRQEQTHQQVSSAEMDITPQTSINKEIKEENGTRADEERDFVMSDFVLDEDFFSGLQDFDDFIAEKPTDHASALKFPVRS